MNDNVEPVFEKQNEGDRVWWVTYPGYDGTLAISFDKKHIYHLFKDYPDKLSAEEKAIFDEENPFWADYFAGR